MNDANRKYEIKFECLKPGIIVEAAGYHYVDRMVTFHDEDGDAVLAASVYNLCYIREIRHDRWDTRNPDGVEAAFPVPNDDIAECVNLDVTGPEPVTGASMEIDIRRRDGDSGGLPFVNEAGEIAVIDRMHLISSHEGMAEKMALFIEYIDHNKTSLHEFPEALNAYTDLKDYLRDNPGMTEYWNRRLTDGRKRFGGKA